MGITFYRVQTNSLYRFSYNLVFFGKRKVIYGSPFVLKENAKICIMQHGVAIFYNKISTFIPNSHYRVKFTTPIINSNIRFWGSLPLFHILYNNKGVFYL